MTIKSNNRRTLVSRVFVLLFAVLFSFAALVSCEADGGNEETEAAAASELPLVTLMKLESDNEDSYLFDEINEAASEAADENGCLYNVYQVTGKSGEQITDALFEAAAENAALIICVGAAFCLPLDEVAPIYDDVSFLSLGAGEHSYKNVTTAEYAEEEASFASGYMAVASGMRRLGFLGSMEVPSVINSGNGFLQGVDCAAKKLGVQDEVTVNIAYTESYAASEYGTYMSGLWYDEGSELIFTKGIGGAQSAAKAASSRNTAVIAFDVNEKSELPSEVLCVHIDYKNVIKGIVSSFVSNGCCWHYEAAGSAYSLDASDGVYKCTWKGEALSLDTALFEEALAVLREGGYPLEVYTEPDIFAPVDVTVEFYDE